MVKRVKENQIILTTFTTVLLGDIGSSTNIPLIAYLSGLDFASADCTFVYSPFSYSSLHPAQKNNPRRTEHKLFPSLVTGKSKSKYKLLNTLTLNLRYCLCSAP